MAEAEVEQVISELRLFNHHRAADMLSALSSGVAQLRADLAAARAGEVDREALARVIWETSRRDEGTISATGANNVADAVLSLLAARGDAEPAAAWRAGCRHGIDSSNPWWLSEPDAEDQVEAIMAENPYDGGS